MVIPRRGAVIDPTGEESKDLPSSTEARLQSEEKTLLTEVVHQDNAVLVSENPSVSGFLGLILAKSVRPGFGQLRLEFCQNIRIDAVSEVMYVYVFPVVLIVPGFDRAKYDFLVSGQMDLIPQPSRMAYRLTFLPEREFREATTFFAKWQKYKTSVIQEIYLDKIGRVDQLEVKAQLLSICRRIARAHSGFFQRERDPKTLIPTLEMPAGYASLEVGSTY